jgi:2-iminobutanoate/2-iminopropanoate deaminase
MPSAESSFRRGTGHFPLRIPRGGQSMTRELHKKAAAYDLIADRQAVSYPNGSGTLQLWQRRKKSMARTLNPDNIRAPFGRYSHGIDLPAGARLVVCSGQLGVDPDDGVAETVAGQTERCFENIKAILGEAGMTLADVVRINAFVTTREHMKDYMAVRDRYVVDPLPASTLMIVSGFTRPEFLVEVEVIAAREIE